MTAQGTLNLKKARFATDFNPIESDCDCLTCKSYTRAYVHLLATRETVGCHLITLHNLAYQSRLMQQIRTAIEEDKYPQFVKKFFKTLFKTKDKYPVWAVNALKSVNIDLMVDDDQKIIHQ